MHGGLEIDGPTEYAMGTFRPRTFLGRERNRLPRLAYWPE